MNDPFYKSLKKAPFLPSLCEVNNILFTIDFLLLFGNISVLENKSADDG